MEAMTSRCSVSTKCCSLKLNKAMLGRFPVNEVAVDLWSNTIAYSQVAALHACHDLAWVTLRTVKSRDPLWVRDLL